MSTPTNTQEITVGDQLVLCREMTVLQVRKWLEDAGAAQPIDAVSAALFSDCSLEDVKRMTDLTDERIDTLKPSQVQLVIDVCKKLNPHFFSLLSRLTGATQPKA